MRIIILFLILASSVFNPNGFAKGNPIEASPAKTSLKVALLPDEDAASVIKQHEKFKQYLAQQLNMNIELVVTSDYSSMIEAVRNKRVDLAYFGPLSYVLAKSRAAIEPFAAKTKGGSTTYQAVIIKNTGKAINLLNDLSGADIAFGDPASTSSHLIPKAMLADVGLVAGKNYQEHFVGSHDAVAIAVQHGNAAAGGLSKPIFESLLARGIIDENRVKVIAESKPFPQYPWVMQSGLNPQLKEKIKTAFYTLKDQQILDNFKAEGMASVTDKDYDVVRELKAALNL